VSLDCWNKCGAIYVSCEYLKSVHENLVFLKSKGDRTISQLSLEELHWKPNDESNSIAIIVKHLHGNMVSRWTDFLTSDGEKPTRERDLEFEGGYFSKEELLQSWENGWNLVFNALDMVDEKQLLNTVYLRGEPRTVLRAIQSELVHYASHIGQMIYIGKQIKNREWQNLSIPRGKSREFHENKLEKMKKDITSS
jgi:hypothetical protein